MYLICQMRQLREPCTNNINENGAGAMVGEGQPQDMEISSEGSTPTSEHYPTTLPPQQHHSLIDAHVPSSSSTITGSLVSLSSTVNKSLQPGIIRSEVSSS